MGWLSSILGIVSGWLGWQSKRQERLNAPDIVANKDAQRDRDEKERVQSAVEKSDKGGQVSEDERKLYAED